MWTRYCCCHVKTCGLIIGWLGSVVSAISTIVMIWALSNIDQLVKDAPNSRTAVIITFSLVLIFAIINLTTSALLIKGINQSRPKLIVPWLVNAGIGFCFYVINSLYNFILICSSGSGGAIFGTLLIICIGIAFQLHIIYAIFCIHKSMTSNHLTV